MTSLRVRRPGSSEWTYIYLSGEEDEHVILLLGSRLISQEWIVEREGEGEWIPLDEYEGEEE